MSYKVYLVGILLFLKSGTGQVGKSWGMRQRAATAANFQSDVVHPVGTGLEGFRVPLIPRPQLKSVW
jgi:hypothetical protein